MFTHEQTYKGINPVSLIHRSRLKSILRLFHHIPLKQQGTLADFGCSNGFILEELQKHVLSGKEYRYVGYDHAKELLKLAKQRRLKNTSFEYIDLNKVKSYWHEQYDIATCFETLEHTGDFRNAFITIYHATQANGYILISIPNEKGIPGLLKFFGRKMVRKNPYADFFPNQNEATYVKHLLLNKPIDIFRQPEAEGWGPHLGFDWKVFEDFIRDDFLNKNKLVILKKIKIFGGFNFLYLFKKLNSVVTDTSFNVSTDSIVNVYII